MGHKNDFDITGTVKVTEAQSVCHEVCHLYSALYRHAPIHSLQQAFSDFDRLFHGRYPGYLGCDTPYHDIHHSLDVTLAMMRLISGYESSHPHREQLGQERALLGIICALFHDAGYIRKIKDRRHANGAAYTAKHVSRSGRFLAGYLPTIGLSGAASIASRLVHYTGYEIATDDIKMPDPKLRQVGCMLGTADLIAQMADRCYLEKCKDRLYFEFAMAYGSGIRGSERYGFESAEYLLHKTPSFIRFVEQDRLNGSFNSMHRFAATYFGGRHYYFDARERHYHYLQNVLARKDYSMLRRRPPWTLSQQRLPVHLAAAGMQPIEPQLLPAYN